MWACTGRPLQLVIWGAHHKEQHQGSKGYPLRVHTHTPTKPHPSCGMSTHPGTLESAVDDDLVQVPGHPPGPARPPITQWLERSTIMPSIAPQKIPMAYGHAPWDPGRGKSPDPYFLQGAAWAILGYPYWYRCSYSGVFLPDNTRRGRI